MIETLMQLGTTQSSMKQRTNEWSDDYHERQFKDPYRSSISFCNWLEEIGFINSESQLRILDLGCGMGANIYYMSGRYPNSTFLGVDIDSEVVKKGDSYFKKNGIENCRLEVGDIYNLDAKYIGNFDGVISFQTLLVLKSLPACQAMAKLAPQWIAINSTFYDGQVSCNIEATSYDDSLEPYKNTSYNVHSLPIVMNYLKRSGYADSHFTPFEIDIDLPKPNKKIMTTYTEKLENGHRLQISGPLLMSWYFIAARK